MATILSSADLLHNGIDHLSARERDEQFQSVSIAVRRMTKVLMRHIFENRLSNAVKYFPKGSVVDFDVRYALERFHFTVTDYGIGIPEPDLPRLFECFHSANNVGNIPGTGLGLAIVKRSVDRHAGTIAVASTVGEGATFSIPLPRSSSS